MDVKYLDPVPRNSFLHVRLFSLPDANHGQAAVKYFGGNGEEPEDVRTPGGWESYPLTEAGEFTHTTAIALIGDAYPPSASSVYALVTDSEHIDDELLEGAIKLICRWIKASW